MFVCGEWRDTSDITRRMCLVMLDLEGNIMPYFPPQSAQPDMSLNFFRDSIYSTQGYGGSGGYFKRYSILGEHDLGYYQNNSTDSTTLGALRYLFIEDSKIIFSGVYYKNGEPFAFDHDNDNRIRFARVNLDLTFDTTWRHDITGDILDMVHYDQERILINGFFYYYDSTGDIYETNSCFLRVDHNGDIDTTFSCEFLYPGGWRHMKVLADGKILVHGRFQFQQFSPYADLGECYLIRLHPDGQLDTDFQILNEENLVVNNFQLSGGISDVEVLPSGSYLIGGLFDSIQGQQRGNIAIIDTTGQLDLNNFNLGGCDSCAVVYASDYPEVYGIFPTDDNKYYIYGKFGRYNGEDCSPIIRIFGENYISTPEFSDTSEEISIYPNPAKDNFHLELPGGFNHGNLQIFNIDGKLVKDAKIIGNSLHINIESLLPGTYICKVRHKDKSYQSKLIIL